MRVEAVKQYSLLTQRHEKKSRADLTTLQATSVPLGENCVSDLSKDNYFANFALSFQGVDRAPQNFSLKKTFGLNCTCCGQLMLTKKQKTSFVSKVGDKTGEELRKELIKGYRFYRPNEEEIVNVLIEDSEKNPGMDLKSLVQLEAQGSKSRLEAEQKKILRKMSREADALSPKNKAEVKAIVLDAYKSIKDADDEAFFQRKPFVAKIEKIEAATQGGQKTLNSIRDMALKMPNSLTSKDAFFVKYARRENKEIAERLCAPAMVTTEHIQPQSENGKDNTENYIPMCSDCNSRRGTTPYNEWFLEHPEMPENLQKYIDTIYQKIQDKEIENDTEINEEYLREVISAVAKATEGELMLKMPEAKIATEETKEEEEEIPIDIEEQREGWLKDYYRLTARADELREVYEKIKDDEEFHNIIEYVKVSNELRLASEAKNSAQCEFSTAKKREGQAERNLEAVLKDKKRTQELKEAQDRARQTKETASVAEERYKRANEYHQRIKAKFEAIKAKISTPESLNGKINETKKHIDEYTALKAKAARLKEEITPEDEYVVQLGLLNSRIAELTTASEALLEEFNMNTGDATESMHTYETYKEQIEMINNVDMQTFKKAFGKTTTDPNFILQDAKEAAEHRMDELISQNKMAKYLCLQDEIENLNDEKAGINQELSTIEKNRSELKRVQTALRKYKGELSPSSLDKKLKELMERKHEVELKFECIDIEEKIKCIERRANDIMQQYCESYET